MMVQGVIRRIVILGCFALGFVFFAQLGFACIELSKFSSPKDHVNSLSVWWNPFFSSEIKNQELIELGVVEARQRLTYMMFPIERAQAATKVLAALQYQINRHPFNYLTWTELITRQQESNSTGSDRLWSIGAALMLEGWNKEYRVRVSSGCIEEPPILFETAPALCRTLLHAIPKRANARSAQLMGVNHRFLKRRLAELDQVYLLAPRQRERWIEAR